MDIREIEEKVRKYWKKEGIEKKALEAKGKPFYFLDGPPYASGAIHMGTAINKVLKDFYIRFWRMQGFAVWSQPGYDTHGLPIENKVEKKLGFQSKEDIEKFGIEKFNFECRNFVTERISQMNRDFHNLGIWMDWNKPYLTLDNSYIEGAWFTFKKGSEKGLLYKGVYPVHACSHCATAVAYNEIEYTDLEDPVVYVKFRIRGQNEYLVIYTTTPWTLPSNTGIMVSPEFSYAKVKAGNEVWIVAEKLVPKLTVLFGIDFKILKTVKGKELEGLRYESPLTEFVPQQKGIDRRVVCSAQFVSLDEGTGLVHSAPGHGKEDFKVAQEKKLSVLCPVGLDGKFNSEAGKYAGKYVKDADDEIMADLKGAGALVMRGKIKHSYPICWRCKTPLILISVPQWFFKVSTIRDKLIEQNKEVNWVPDWAGKRFDDWLHGLGDWPVSRQRYWGIPLPIWTCNACSEVKVVGSAKELPVKLKDLHRPFIDAVKLKCKCGSTMNRVQDVLDVWFDAGVAPWASLNYPKDKKLFEKLGKKVEFELEGADQFRGWWNAESITGIMTLGYIPFKTVVYHGMILDAKGIKMSKSLGNIISPADVIKRYGRDVLRFYLLSKDPAEDINFDWADVEKSMDFFLSIENLNTFIKTYCSGNRKLKGLKIEDEWIISRLNILILKASDLMENYKGFQALQEIRKFALGDLSRVYIKLIRDRIKGRDRDSVSAVLNTVYNSLITLLAPALPHISEHYYMESRKRGSIHFESWPKVGETNKELEGSIELALRVVETANEARAAGGIKLKYLLPEIKIAAQPEVIKKLKTVEKFIESLVNVEKVGYGTTAVTYDVKPNYSVAGKKFGQNVKRLAEGLLKIDGEKLKKELEGGKTKVSGLEIEKGDIIFREVSEEGFSFTGGKIFLETKVSEKLKVEWLIREFIRSVQAARKEMGLKIGDKVILSMEGKEFKGQEKRLEEATGSKLKFGKLEGKEFELEFEEKKYRFGVKK